MDRLYSVSWPAGEIQAHGFKESDMIGVALEYLRAKNLIKVERKTEQFSEPEPVCSHGS